MSELLIEQYRRLLKRLPAGDPWPTLELSGFLNLLRSERDGGAGVLLEGLFPLALETAGEIQPPPIVETMVARLIDPLALNVSDLERALGDSSVARPLAAAIAATQMAGAMIRVQSMTLEYAATRRQFGREIGKFQAVQHQLAIMAEEVLAARMASQAAMVGEPFGISERRAGAAKLRVGEAAELVSAIAHAVHGAIGISQEYPLHHYTRHLRIWRLAHGGESWWARRLGDWSLSQAAGALLLARTL
jgi:hypothetical protein